MIKLTSFIPEIKIQPNIQPRNNKELLFFINRNKKEVVEILLKTHVGDDWELYYNETIATEPIIYRDNLHYSAWWQGTVKFDIYYLTIEDVWEESIDIKGIKIYVR